MKALVRIFHLGIKELASLRHDPILLLFVVYAFSLDIITATDQAVQVKNAAVAVVDEDRSTVAQRIVAGFQEPEFQPPERISVDAIDEALDSGRYTFVLDIPPDFQADLVAGKSPTVQLNVDATAVGQAFTGAVYIQRIIEDETRRFLQKSERAPPIDAVVRIQYNANAESTWFLGVAELLLMVTVLSIMLPAAALIREQEHGTIEHLLVMPLTPAEIMLAKIWSNALVVQVGATLSLWIIIQNVLATPIPGSTPLFLLGTLVYQFSATAIGMVLATLVRTVAQFVLVLMLVVTPMVFLSGVFTPAESMPGWLRDLMAISPLRYYVDFSMAVLFRDADLTIVRDELVMMAAIGLAVFLVAMARFRRHFSTAG